MTFTSKFQEEQNFLSAGGLFTISVTAVTTTMTMMMAMIMIAMVMMVGVMLLMMIIVSIVKENMKIMMMIPFAF